MRPCDNSDRHGCCYTYRSPRLARSHQNLPLELPEGAQPCHLIDIGLQASCFARELANFLHFEPLSTWCCSRSLKNSSIVTEGSWAILLNSLKYIGVYLLSWRARELPCWTVSNTFDLRSETEKRTISIVTKKGDKVREFKCLGCRMGVLAQGLVRKHTVGRAAWKTLQRDHVPFSFLEGPD